MWAMLSALLLPAPCEIIDRVAAVVGKSVITESDVQKEARLEAYFDLRPAPAPLVPASPEYRQVLDRLIRQSLMRREMEQSRFPSVTDAEAQKELQTMRLSPGVLAAYGLKQADLLDYARRLLDASRFLELRLGPVGQERSAGAVSRQQVEDYYRNVFAPDQARKGKPAPPLDQVRGQIEKSLQEEKELDDWLKDLRSRTTVRVIEPERP